MDIIEAETLAHELLMLATEARADGRREIDLAKLQAAMAARAETALDELQAAIDAAKRQG